MAADALTTQAEEMLAEYEARRAARAEQAGGARDRCPQAQPGRAEADRPRVGWFRDRATSPSRAVWASAFGAAFPAAAGPRSFSFAWPTTI